MRLRYLCLLIFLRRFFTNEPIKILHKTGWMLMRGPAGRGTRVLRDDRSFPLWALRAGPLRPRRQLQASLELGLSATPLILAGQGLDRKPELHDRARFGATDHTERS